MTMEKHYDPKAIEEKWYREWTARGLFHGDASRDGEPYCVMIPPPNVTGILHMGHALNNTIQDILVRWRRMQGRNVIWMPGTDHAGIATQNVVERALQKEGLTRDDLGRDKFIERVWAWREEYGSTIINQLKRLGSSCDWERERFTMDAGLSEAVAEVFVRLYDKGLIHRANYIINWCPRCQTALSDEESEHADTAGKLYYIRYEVRDPGLEGRTEKEFITVATTRPETLLGDVAVAINPTDPRYEDLGERTVVLPILNRTLVVIEDDHVDPAFGTGIVKVTPAHDPNDFEMGQRHGLESVNVMHGDGRMNENAGPYAGMDRFECRTKILADLEAAGLLEKVEEHQHAVGHCYRCDAVVEPRLSPQWFVRMKTLAQPAIEAVKSGQITFVPARWTKVYLGWMENIRDWCISRQIWWGHRIPVFTCNACDHEWAAKGSPTACPACGAGDIRQDEDVLDTWFSSWLWPFSTLGWPNENKDLKRYYPTHDLVTASEIIFFWVARMIMAGYEFMGDLPFRQVYIHGTVRDDKGLKMSKSLGNSIDPLTIIDEFSADALRFSLMMITATGQDVFLSNDKFEIGRNFGTKLWNAARFMQMQAHPGPSPSSCERERADPGADVRSLTLAATGEVAATGADVRSLTLAATGKSAATGEAAPAFDPALLTADDKHILARLQDAIRACNESLERFRFNDAAHALYEFVWHQYCDWYVEYSKEALQGDDPARCAQVLAVMHHVFSNALKLLHPIMPFVTEELFHAMGYAAEAESIMTAPWPEVVADETLAAWGVTDEDVAYVDGKHELIRVARTLRSDYGVVPTKKIAYHLKPHSPDAAARLEADQASLSLLVRAESFSVDPDFAPAKAMPSGVSKLATVYMPLAGLVDVDAEIRRLTAQKEQVEQNLTRCAAKLSNQSFVSRAPAHVVDRQRALQRELAAGADKVGKLIDMLKG